MAYQPFRFKRGGGYRSGSEKQLGEWLKSIGAKFTYESEQLHYIKPAKLHFYKPDWILGNGIILETKGMFESADRQKMLLVKASAPHLDIRFIFDRPTQPINKGSKTTISMWATKHGFKWCDAKDKESILSWIHEQTAWSDADIFQDLKETKKRCLKILQQQSMSFDSRQPLFNQSLMK